MNQAWRIETSTDPDTFSVRYGDTAMRYVVEVQANYKPPFPAREPCSYSCSEYYYDRMGVYHDHNAEPMSTFDTLEEARAEAQRMLVGILDCIEQGGLEELGLPPSSDRAHL